MSWPAWSLPCFSVAAYSDRLAGLSGTHAPPCSGPGHAASDRTGLMRSIRLVAERQIEIDEIPPPPPPAPGEVQVRIRAVALNHIDVWSWRGMAFAKRTLPLV